METYPSGLMWDLLRRAVSGLQHLYWGPVEGLKPSSGTPLPAAPVNLPAPNRSSPFLCVDRRPTQPKMPIQSLEDVDVEVQEADVGNKIGPVIRPNLVEGKYQSLHDYLTIHFWLLKEDCTRPLRNKIERFRTSQVDLKKEAKVYTNVVVEKMYLKGKDTTYKVSFTCNGSDLIEWETVKKLLPGSLVCLSDDMFKTFILGYVTHRTGPSCLSEGEAYLTLRIKPSKLLLQRKFVMLESDAYFEGYRHTMEVLKLMVYYERFPFKEYIVYVKDQIKVPNYLEAGHHYDISKLIKSFGDKTSGKGYDNGLSSMMSGLCISKRFSHFNVLSGRWPLTEETGLDSSQLNAVKLALTHELAIIQGPPGTGKTFTGLRIVDLLIANNKGPILIVCYTNHALDQFLEGILKEGLTTKMVRFGGSCESSLVEPYTISNLKSKLGPNKMSRHRLEISIIQKCNVIGMTTTGAAKNNALLQAFPPQIVIVEEAAEVLEAHVVSCLVPGTEHLILIGDHKQLQPRNADDDLAKNYNFGISLFERLINNGLPFCQLTVQHRMKPSISSLLRPHFYKVLDDHQSVTRLPRVKGITKSVFFINHSNGESLSEETKSFVNNYEANLMVTLCQYLYKQGYDYSQVTILAAYSAQVALINKLIGRISPEMKEGVRVSSVDGYQGEENDVVLVSFVRSNYMGSVGFLKVPNRVNVALSRAKRGLYCVGNFEKMAKMSDFWKNIVATLKSRQELGNKLELFCQNHPKTKIKVSKRADFNLSPEGGCQRQCSKLRPCGHLCLIYCHPRDPRHEVIPCVFPCKGSCKRRHQCNSRCHQPHPCRCTQELVKQCYSCLMTAIRLCHEVVGRFICRECDSEGSSGLSSASSHISVIPKR